MMWFYGHEKEWHIRVVVEQRTRVGATKVRVPDVSVFSRSTPIEQVFTRPQLTAVEVLSPEDRHSRMDRKIANYIEFGVAHIWVVDPAKRTGWNCSNGSWILTKRFSVPGSAIYLSQQEFFRRDRPGQPLALSSPKAAQNFVRTEEGELGSPAPSMSDNKYYVNSKQTPEKLGLPLTSCSGPCLRRSGFPTSGEAPLRSPSRRCSERPWLLSERLR